MSAKMMGKVWELDLPHNEQIVLLAYADHADHDGGSIFPSYDLIAWKTGYKRDSVKRITHLLIEKGILIKVGGGDGRGRPNIFKMMPSAAPQKPPRHIERGVNCTPPSGIEKGGEIGEKGGEINTKGGVQLSPPQPSLEPSIEPSVGNEENTSSLPGGGKATVNKKGNGKSKTPPAVNRFRKAASRYPPKSWYDKIDQAVGSVEEDLLLWEEIVSNYVGCGWNPGNVLNMLEFYSRREIPGRGNGAVRINANGKKVIRV